MLLKNKGVIKIVEVVELHTLYYVATVTEAAIVKLNLYGYDFIQEQARQSYCQQFTFTVVPSGSGYIYTRNELLSITVLKDVGGGVESRYHLDEDMALVSLASP